MLGELHSVPRSGAPSGSMRSSFHSASFSALRMRLDRPGALIPSFKAWLGALPGRARSRLRPRLGEEHAFRGCFQEAA